MMHGLCCASHTMPCVLAVTRFKSLSHRLVVDLSVLRANFTDWRRGSDLFEHLRPTHPCHCAYPHETYSAVKRVIQIIIGHTLSYFKGDQVTRYRIQKK